MAHSPEKPPGRTLVPDEELRRRILGDPAVQERIAETLRQAKKPSEEPGVTEEDLPRFLREHR